MVVVELEPFKRVEQDREGSRVTVRDNLEDRGGSSSEIRLRETGGERKPLGRTRGLSRNSPDGDGELVIVTSLGGDSRSSSLATTLSLLSTVGLLLHVDTRNEGAAAGSEDFSRAEFNGRELLLGKRKRSGDLLTIDRGESKVAISSLDKDLGRADVRETNWLNWPDLVEELVGRFGGLWDGEDRRIRKGKDERTRVGMIESREDLGLGRRKRVLAIESTSFTLKEEDIR